MAKLDYESTNCMICGSEDQIKYSEKGQFGLETHVVICKSCGFSFLNPRWTVQRYNDFYAKEYDKYYREDTISKPGREIEFKNIKAIVERLKNRRLLPSAPLNILDIGSGMGQSLIYLKNNVFKNANYFAIEPSEHCISFLKQNDIKVIANDVFSSWEIGHSNKFDFIIMRHVLEHFNYPIDVLKKVKSVLKDNGIAFIAVPNSYRPTKPLKSHYFRVVHVSYFSPVSLRNVVLLSGLSPLFINEGDEFEQFELFTVCNSKTPVEKLMINDDEWKKQKRIYDTIGKNDFYYTLKASLIRLLRRIKVLK